MIEAFESPDPDPMKEARERIGLSFGRGMKIPLQYCNGHDSQDPLKGSKGVGRWKGIDFTDFSNQTQE